jgi:hypothetical protein
MMMAVAVMPSMAAPSRISGDRRCRQRTDKGHGGHAANDEFACK